VPDDIRYLPVADGSYRHLRPGNPGEHDDAMPGAQSTHFAALESKVDTIAVELAALKLKVVTDISGLKGDIADFKVGVAAGMASLKGDMADFKVGVVADIAGLKSDIADLRTGVGAGIADLKTGVAADIAALKTGIGADIAGLKTGVGADIAGLRSDIAEIRGRLTNMPTTFQVLTWFIGVTIGLTALVFTIARVVR